MIGDDVLCHRGDKNGGGSREIISVNNLTAPGKAARGRGPTQQWDR